MFINNLNGFSLNVRICENFNKKSYVIFYGNEMKNKKLQHNSVFCHKIFRYLFVTVKKIQILSSNPDLTIFTPLNSICFDLNEIELFKKIN